MKKLLLVIGCLGILALPFRADAHAAPSAYQPDGSVVLAVSPSSVRIVFSERVEKGASTIEIYAPDGSRAETGPAVVDPDDRHVLSVPLRASGTGTYVVSWAVVSADDGHFTKGGYAFSVGVENAGQTGGGQFQLQHRSSLGEGITIWLELIGQALLLGLLVLLDHVIRPLREKGGKTPEAWLFSLMGLCGGLLVIGGAGAYLAVQAFSIGGQEATGFLPALKTFLSTQAGNVALQRLLLGVLFLAVFLPLAPRMLRARRITSVEYVLWGALFFMFALRALVSHAAASHILPSLSIVINAAHLFGKDLWIGGVAAFVCVVLPGLLRHRDRREIALAWTALSQITSVGFLVGGLTGTYIVWLHLKGFPNIYGTHWGMQFLSLAVLGFVLLLLRLYQQTVFDPAMSGRTRREGWLSEILGSGWVMLFTEALTGLTVLWFSAFLIITTPPLTTGQTYTLAARSGETSVTLGEHPYDPSLFLVAVAGSRTPVTEATVTLTNAEEDIGPLVATLEKRFDVGYVFPMSALTPPGAWTINVNARRESAYDAVASFTVRYPEDILAARTGSVSRGFGVFEGVLLLLAAVILAASSFLLMRARRLQNLALGLPQTLIAEPPLKAAPGTVTAILLVDLVLIVFLASSLDSHAHGGLQGACAYFKNMWHESVPMRAGRATSNIASMGCMTGMGQGQYHFPDAREYNWFMRPAHAVAEMAAEPALPRPGQPVTLRFTLRDEDGNPVKELVREHDRILHAIVVGSDLRTYLHLHPEDLGPVTPAMLASAVFPVRATFPLAGRYLIAIDFTIRGQQFTQQFYLTVGDTPAAAFSAPDYARVQQVDGYEVRLRLPEPLQSGGGIQRLSYSIFRDNQPVTDLQTYLSAPMHLGIVSEDTRAFFHVHGELPMPWNERLVANREVINQHFQAYQPDRFGPDIDAYAMFPAPGRYIIFGQFRHRQNVILTRFEVEAK